MSLVDNLKSLAKTKGTTIPKLEIELGFGKGSVYNWDKNTPSIDKVHKIASFLDVSIDSLLDYTPSQTSICNDRMKQYSELIFKIAQLDSEGFELIAKTVDMALNSKKG